MVYKVKKIVKNIQVGIESMDDSYWRILRWNFIKGLWLLNLLSNSFKFVGESTWGRKSALILLKKDKGYKWKIKIL